MSMSDNPAPQLEPEQPPLKSWWASPSASIGPKTQKLKGVMAVIRNLGEYSAVPVLFALKKGDDRRLVERWFHETTKEKWGGSQQSLPLFARPCPVSPRHGFVDSRKVSSVDDIMQVWDETLKADPEGELIIMPCIEATHNAVWTPTLLTFGKGHDGATAGKDVVMLPYVKGKWLNMPSAQSAGLKPDQAPYVEAVKDQWSNWKYTQLRGGPPLEGVGPDYIPHQVKVKDVIRPIGPDGPMDLLVWESTIQERKDEEGLVVWHPGGSPTDHFSVHCRSHNLPIVTSRMVNVGDVLEPTSNLKADPQKVLVGLIRAEKMKLDEDDYFNAGMLMLHSLHHSAVMVESFSEWIGFGAAIMLRLGSMALAGEARHAMIWREGQWHHPGGKQNREQVYHSMAPKSLSYHHARLSRWSKVFRYGRFSSVGMGGHNWAICAHALIPLFEAVKRLAQQPDDEAVGGLIRALNVAVNQAHNGGWWLNKFMPDPKVMDECQNPELGALLNLCDNIYRFRDTEITDEQVERKRASWAGWAETKPTQLRITSAEVIPDEQSNITFTIKLKAKEMANRLKEIRIPLTGELISQILKHTGELRVESDELMSVALVRKDGGRDVLWQEKSITPRSDWREKVSK